MGLTDVQLADPGFRILDKIDLLGVEVFVEVTCHGQQLGVPGSPEAFKTENGWVLAGGIDSCSPTQQITTHHAALLCRGDILHQFLGVEKRVAHSA